MITEKDLVGQIAGFPIEVVEKMLERQKEQTGGENVEIFQEHVDAGGSFGGFSWGKTIEGYDFWERIIRGGNFTLFFSEYPKRNDTIISINKSTKVKLNFKL